MVETHKCSLCDPGLQFDSKTEQLYKKKFLKGNTTLRSHLILFIEVPLKATELWLMHLSSASSILPMEIVLDVVAA